MSGSIIKQDQALRSIVQGRTLADQIDYVRANGTHALARDLRERIFNAMDLYPDFGPAENVIHLSCYVPYRMPLVFRSYFMLLDRLGVAYTFLRREYCCGAAWMEASGPHEAERASSAAGEFVNLNVRLAQEQGAKNIVYLCKWCAASGKRYAGDSPLRQMYFPDLVVEKLRDRPLRVAPAVIGYYKGCNARLKCIAPGVTMDWQAYRDLVERIEGLRVVNVPNICCVSGADKVLAKAERLGLDTIVSPCSACHSRLKSAARGRLRIKFYTDLLLEALEGGAA